MTLTIYPSKTHNHTMPRPGKEVSCRGCRAWFDGLLAECPGCGWRRPSWNKWLRTAKLNGTLNGQVDRNHREQAFIKAAHKENYSS